MQDQQNAAMAMHGAKLRRNKGSKGKTIMIIAAVLVIAILGTFIFLQQKRINDSGVAALEAAADTKAAVAKIMLLPEEEAIVSEIDNAASVRNQAFFAQVEDGDKVLVFATAAKIVIFRPSTKQIVNAGPIVDDSAIQQQQSQDAQE
jgi:hypothetical protein